MTEDYEIGYGRPPKSRQFKKGRSGNPKGRPKGSLNLKTIVRRELAEMGHRVEVPEVPLGGAQAIIVRPEGGLMAGSDPRKDGCALGY